MVIELPETPGAEPPIAEATTSSKGPPVGLEIPLRPTGVVLVAANDSLNIREQPGAKAPIIDVLHHTRRDLIPTGRSTFVGPSPWHEITVGGAHGWVHGRYITELWESSVVFQEWDWRAALRRFAVALDTGEGLADAVSWRGLYVADPSWALHGWAPSELPGLVADENTLQWNATDPDGRSPTGHPYTFSEAIADVFLDDYNDPDTVITDSGAPTDRYALPPSLANFPWIAMYAPMDNAPASGLGWYTTFVFLELDEYKVAKIAALYFHSPTLADTQNDS